MLSRELANALAATVAALDRYMAMTYQSRSTGEIVRSAAYSAQSTLEKLAEVIEAETVATKERRDGSVTVEGIVRVSFSSRAFAETWVREHTVYDMLDLSPEVDGPNVLEPIGTTIDAHCAPEGATSGSAVAEIGVRMTATTRKA